MTPTVTSWNITDRVGLATSASAVTGRATTPDQVDETGEAYVPPNEPAGGDASNDVRGW